MRQRICLLILGVFFVLSMGTVAVANAATVYSPEMTQELLGFKYKIHALQEMAQSGVITKLQAETGIKDYLSSAQEIGGEELTLNKLLLLRSSAQENIKLTALQKFAGYITFVNVLWVIGICLGVVCFGYLAIHYCQWLFENFKYIPKEVSEVFFYLTSVGFMVGGYFLSSEIGTYISLTGCLVFGGALVFTAHIHQLEKKATRFFLILFVVYVIVALAIQSQLIGFIAVIALMGSLGFSGVVIPCGYLIGFEDKAALGRSTSAAFIILGAYIAMHLTSQYVPFFQLFEKGALFMGSFVGYLGLLIASNKWYDGTRSNYWTMQVITIIAGVAALAIGSIFGIKLLLRIGGTFFVLYLIEKPFEIPAQKGTQYALIGLGVSFVIYLSCLFAKSHTELASTFLLYSF